MKKILLLFACTFLAILASADAVDIPKVMKSYTTVKSDAYIGKPLKDIIHPETIKLIALTKNRGKGSPMTENFKPDWDSDSLMNEIFSSSDLSVAWTSDAWEAIFAEYTIVTDDGLFLLEFCGSIMRQEPLTAVLVRGDGFGCRFNIEKEKEVPDKTED